MDDGRWTMDDSKPPSIVYRLSSIVRSSLPPIPPIVILSPHVAELHFIALGPGGVICHGPALEHLHQHVVWLSGYVHVRPVGFGYGIARDVYPIPRLAF